MHSPFVAVVGYRLGDRRERGGSDEREAAAGTGGSRSGRYRGRGTEQQAKDQPDDQQPGQSGDNQRPRPRAAARAFLVDLAVEQIGHLLHEHLLPWRVSRSVMISGRVPETTTMSVNRPLRRSMKVSGQADDVDRLVACPARRDLRAGRDPAAGTGLAAPRSLAYPTVDGLVAQPLPPGEYLPVVPDGHIANLHPAHALDHPQARRAPSGRESGKS